MCPQIYWGLKCIRHASDILKGKEANVGEFRVTLLVTGLKMCYCVPLPFLIERNFQMGRAPNLSQPTHPPWLRSSARGCLTPWVYLPDLEALLPAQWPSEQEHSLPQRPGTDLSSHPLMFQVIEAESEHITSHGRGRIEFTDCFVNFL